MCIKCMPGANRSQKKTSKFMELELQMVVTYHLGAGNLTQVFTAELCLSVPLFLCSCVCVLLRGCCLVCVQCLSVPLFLCLGCVYICVCCSGGHCLWCVGYVSSCLFFFFGGVCESVVWCVLVPKTKHGLHSLYVTCVCMISGLIPGKGCVSFSSAFLSCLDFFVGGLVK